MSDKIDLKVGWGWPMNSKKAHWFNNGRALCGKWLYMGALEEGNDTSSDNCAECKKRKLKCEEKGKK